jgi:hypothetical protein
MENLCRALGMNASLLAPPRSENRSAPTWLIDMVIRLNSLGLSSQVRSDIIRRIAEEFPQSSSAFVDYSGAEPVNDDAEYRRIRRPMAMES